MASNIATNRKRPKKGPGRPPSEIDWQGLSVRFKPEEKKRIETALKKTGGSKAELIRAGTMHLVKRVEREGAVDISEATFA